VDVAQALLVVPVHVRVAPNAGREQTSHAHTRQAMRIQCLVVSRGIAELINQRDFDEDKFIWQPIAHLRPKSPPNFK
jgi:hypothetical protein